MIRKTLYVDDWKRGLCYKCRSIKVEFVMHKSCFVSSIMTFNACFEIKISRDWYVFTFVNQVTLFNPGFPSDHCSRVRSKQHICRTFQESGCATLYISQALFLLYTFITCSEHYQSCIYDHIFVMTFKVMDITIILEQIC